MIRVVLITFIYYVQVCQCTPLASDTHSLSCKIIVKARTTPRQPWYEAQCSLDEVPFLWYDNDNKATPLGDLGKVAHATKAWRDFAQSLQNIGEELREQLLNTEPEEEVKTKGHHTLQVTMESQYKQEKLTDASWNFTTDQKHSFYFNLENEKWGVIHDKDIGIMKQWETNRELAQGLRKFSMGDSRHCLKEFLKHWKEIPRSTSRAPDITQLTSTTQLPPTIQLHNKGLLIFVAAVIAIIFLSVIVRVVKKCCPPRRNHQLPINCYKPQRKERPMEPIGELPNQATKMLSQEDEPKT